MNEPTTDDLLQEEVVPAQMTAIPVVVEGPVRVQQPGAKTASMVNVTLPQSGPAQILLGEDRRRTRVLLYATTGTAAFYVGSDKRIVNADGAARFNSGVAFELFVTTALYAKSASTADCQLTVIAESWAD